MLVQGSITGRLHHWLCHASPEMAAFGGVINGGSTTSASLEAAPCLVIILLLLGQEARHRQR